MQSVLPESDRFGKQIVDWGGEAMVGNQAW